MKPIWKVVIGISGSVILIVLNIFIVVIADVEHKLRWSLPSIIAVILAWAIVGISSLIIKLRKRPVIKEKLDIKTAQDKAINYMKYDTENPDNFHIKDIIKSNKGESGKDKTPIVWFKGSGTENNNKEDILINLNDIKGEPIRLQNQTDEYIQLVMEEFAENPSHKVIEEKIRSTDPFGRPVETVKTTKSSEAKKEEEEAEQKKAQAF